VSAGDRVTEYDRVAPRFDTRYALYEYAGTRDAVLNFVATSLDVLEVGCGTGHWLNAVRSSWSAAGSPESRRLVGVEPSMPMLAQASGLRVRARAEQLPFPDASFDRLFCVNALHHFSDRRTFFAEARRVLRPGGGLMTIGKDPHAGRDTWWVYDYFAETREIDRQRFAPVRILRGELAHAGFMWAESFEADHIEVVQTAAEAFAKGVIDPTFTSQLSVLTDDEFRAGVARIQSGGEELPLVADFFLFATVGWVGQA
jgi:ubiquinone/menaquinone biosynthesis C-methylase UbiE